MPKPLKPGPSQGHRARPHARVGTLSAVQSGAVDACVSSGSSSFSVDRLRDSSMDDDSSLKTEEWLDSKEAAAYLRVSVGALRNMASNGQVPYYKLGKRNRYLKSDLQGLLLANRRGGI